MAAFTRHLVVSGAPHGIRAYFGSLYQAFPDFVLEVIDLTTYRNRSAVRLTAISDRRRSARHWPGS